MTTNLLKFARKPVQNSPAPAGDKRPEPSPPQPEKQTQPAPFIAGQAYTLTGRDVYQAHQTGSGWILEDLNRCYQGYRWEVTYGYFFKQGRLYLGEYCKDIAGGRWQVPLAPVDLTPSDFRPCEVETQTFILSDWI